MSNVKKNILFIFSFIIIFIAGFFSGSFNSNRKITELEAGTAKLELKLETETGRVAEITKQLNTANREIEQSRDRINKLSEANKKLTERNRTITEENKRITESIGNISTGIGEDQERLSGVITELDYYIEQGNEQN